MQLVLTAQITHNAIVIHKFIGPVHKGVKHVPKAVSDHDLLPDRVRDSNYVRSQTLQTAILIMNRISVLRGNILFLLR